ncbi:hypothetical protein NQ318_023116 [Aromia moschata]|uniref:G-protein coupled receptors family 1 profile domain-containing protein n=1 Tax=Aromia moschata TaxID=1265417 RepID=A0AAV8XSU3_9CUCU|nr:hypothetical protein NQ318_023116 [Aromia moschata]
MPEDSVDIVSDEVSDEVNIIHLTGNRSGQVNTFAMNMNASTEGQLRSRRKAAKMLVAVVVMFAFCFLPVHLLSVLRLVPTEHS